jgi:hypothetical protein
MAKYFVLEAHQDPQSQAYRHVKKSAGETLLRKNLARRIAHNIIQLVAIREAVQILAQSHKPIEIPQLEPPRTPDWFFTSYPIKDERTLIL